MATMVPWGSRLTQLLDDAFFSVPSEAAEWSNTHANVVETEGGYEITMDLPGLNSDEFHVEYADGRLTISGERKFERKDEGKTYHRVERRYGKFLRTFALPRDVDAENIEANYDRGVLTVHVPKAESRKPRRIEVK
ncbi:MAG: Hsp20/alpha crystallin family protein [Planctomycetales bacterium]|nr:Hsp20/alpha crystallin family protein [Planctomycetales bacterium]